MTVFKKIIEMKEEEFPGTNEWEEDFLFGLYDRFEKYGSKIFLSPNQIATINSLHIKFEQGRGFSG